MASMIRRSAFLALSLVGAVLIWTCGPSGPPKCQPSNCSGCCGADGSCLGTTRQSPQACGSSGSACKVCLPDQLCSGGKCLHDPDAGFGGGDGGGAGGGSGGGATGGGAGGGSGGGTACGQQGQACCNGFQCTSPLLCQQATCHAPPPDAGPCGLVGQPCCNRAVCFNGALCGILGSCVDAPDAGPADSGTLSPLGAPCNVSGTCADGLCQVANGFSNGYCTKACATQGDCPAGSQCSSYPGRGTSPLLCLGDCSPAGQVGTCRAGYVCERANSSLSGVAVCVPACTPSTCGGATCDARGFCCGTAGRACCSPGSTCDATSACSGGYCAPTACGGASQPCCAGSTCNGPGLTCSGGSCVQCGQQSQPCCGGACASSSLVCSGGSCVACGTGGTLCPTGEACTVPSQCAGSTCITPGATIWVGGYCTQDCDGGVCASGSACSPYLAPPRALCGRLCDWDGGAGGCRQNYICERNLLPNPSQGMCYSACQSSADCGTLSCQNGFCCGARGFRCCTGTPCPSGGTCGSLGYCQ